MGIRGKLIISTVLLALLISAAPVFFALAHQRRVIEQEFEQRSLFVTQHLSHKLGDLARKLDTINDAKTVANSAKKQDVIAAYALDTDGQVLTNGSKQAPAGKVEHFERMRGELAQSNRFVTLRESGLVHAAGPVVSGDEVCGYVYIVMSLERAGSIVAGTVSSVLIVMGIAVVLACVLAVIIAHLLCRPFGPLLEGARALRSGDHRIRIPVRSNDEFGRLAEAINDMAAGLRATTVSKRYLDEVLQSMVDCLIVVDTEGTMVTVNKATLEMLGYTESQLVGQSASLVIIDKGYQFTGARLKHLLGEQTQQDYEIMYRTSDGDEIPISFSGSPIFDNGGETVGYVCIGKDISERKRGEKEREKLNKQLVDTSRRAGMAEVATGVLHNVGNVLNSVNMSASLVVDAVRKSKVAGLSKAVQLISNHREDIASFISEDEKGKRIPDYLAQLSQQLADEQSGILNELDSLTKNINHIKDIISMQQSYSKVTGVIEPMTVRDLAEEALRMNEMMLERHRVTVRREFQDLPEIRTDKHKTLQILVNLITNAKDAMDGMAPEERVVTVRLRADEETGKHVRIEVTDRGEGIPEENLTNIFKHGFTTKKKGNGFGLHSAALTAKELGGSLRVFSDGPGKGATFVLSLPMQVTEVAA